jgi:hypothetical protein
MCHSGVNAAGMGQFKEEVDAETEINKSQIQRKRSFT